MIFKVQKFYTHEPFTPMINRVVFILLLFHQFAHFSFSQDYQMFYSDRISYFETEYSQIKCVRIDAIEAGVDSVFIPFSNIWIPESHCATPYGGSWIGKRIITQNNGDHLFITVEKDTLLIRTKASVGETWLAFNSPGLPSFQAEVSAMDTLSFLGQTDTVKTIIFNALNEKNEPVDHVVNGLTVVISKRFGAVRTLNFNLFPDRKSYGYYHDHLREMDLVGLSRPQIGVQNLTWSEVHDFQEGDEIHVLLEMSNAMPEYGYKRSIYQRTIKKFHGRKEYTDSIVYTYERKQSTHNTWTDSSAVEFIFDTATIVIQPNPSFDMLPGEPVFRDLEAYSHTMIRTEPISKTIPAIYGWLYSQDDSCWSDCCADGCFQDFNYIKGLGGPYGACSNAFSLGGFEEKLVYYKKGAVTWGTPFVLTGFETGYSSRDIKIYPNPAFENLWVESSHRLIKRVRIFDITGKLVLNQVFNANVCQLNLERLKPGIYIMKAMFDNGEHTDRIILE